MQDPRSLAHDIYALISKQDLEGFLSRVADDVVEHEPPPIPNPPTGKAAVRMWFETLFAAFPDLTMTADDTIVEGDKVAIRARATGTHQGELMGIPATGRAVDVPLIDIMRFRDGQIIEHWGIVDNAAMMEQLGAMPG